MLRLCRKVIEIYVLVSLFRASCLLEMRCPKLVLKRYRELGGELVTIGSDTHETAHLADHIPEVKEELKMMGYQTFCTFERMKPIIHNL